MLTRHRLYGHGSSLILRCNFEPNKANKEFRVVFVLDSAAIRQQILSETSPWVPFFNDFLVFLFVIFFCFCGSCSCVATLLSGSACWFLLLAFCSLLAASLFLLLLFCFLLSALYHFCFLHVAFGFMFFAFCVFSLLSVFLLSAFCFLLLAFCFYVFWTESKNGCNKTIAITAATITVTLTKDSHYSNFFTIFIVTNTITGAVVTSSFPVTNERASRNNKRASTKKKTNERQEKNQRINAAICSIRERTRLQLV